jgi:O-antigen/teichoic acid export membrane protein
MSEAQRLGRNFALITIAQVITQVLAFLVSVTVARQLGVALYGLFVFGFAFPSWIVWLVSFEFDSVVAIEVAADKSKAGPYLTAVTLLRLPLALGAFAILWISVKLVISDPFAQAITLILGIASILGTYASVYRTMFQAFERLEFAALVMVVERSISTAAILILLYLGFGLLQVSLVYVFTTMVATVLSLAILKSRFVWFSPKVGWATMIEMVRKAVPYALDAVASTFLYSAGPLLATVLANSTATGEFNAAFSLVLALLAPLSVYAIVVLPSLSRMYHETQETMNKVIYKSEKLFFMIGLPVALGGAFFAGSIVTLVYGSAFADAARSFEILMMVVATSTFSVGLMAALAATGHQKLNLAITIGATVTNVVLCIVLIPILGHVGAAWAFLAAELVTIVPSRFVVRRLLGSLHLVEVALRPLLAGAAMVLVLSLLPGLSLFLGIGAGAAVYFLVLLALGGVTREDWGVVKEMARGVLSRGEADLTASSADPSESR